MATAGQSASEGPPADRYSTDAVPVEKLLALLDSGDWEKFMEEWAEGADPKYHHVDRMGGPGDKGRDLQCFVGPDATTSDFDLVQCKRYAVPLGPADLVFEVAKLCIHTFKGSFRKPRRYLFAAPLGLTPQSIDLLRDPEKLRARLVKDWPKHIENAISKKEAFPLVGDLKKHVESFDLRTVGYLPVAGLIAQHKRTPHFRVRFKRDPPKRPRVPVVPPEEIAPVELRYVSELLAAYAEHSRVSLVGASELPKCGDQIHGHFRDCRIDFYTAESLNRFYRDNLFEGAFDELKDDLHSGITNVIAADHADGYGRLVATLTHATDVQLPETEYRYCVRPGDRKGICHHLVNDGKFKWTR